MKHSLSSRALRVEQYIKENWEKCIRESDPRDEEFIQLPHPFIVPSITGGFQELFYWDTFFTCIGLQYHEYDICIKNNTDNLLYMVKQLGFVPNSNRKIYENRSQPPYLSMLVRQVYELYKDKTWLLEAYSILKIEYKFWEQRRQTETGLSHYSQDADKTTLENMYRHITNRLQLNNKSLTSQEQIRIGAHYLAECESGWDFTPRFGGRCSDFIPVDLNVNLYLYEKNFSYFVSELDIAEPLDWDKLAEERKENICSYCWNEQMGLFMDYDYTKQRHTEIASLVTFWPMWAGIASFEQAERIVKQLERFEYDFGLAACENKQKDITYQWDFPNGWAPLQYIAIEGLRKYNYSKESFRIALKYVETVTSIYETTGQVWEKYNVLNGSIDVANEYEMPAMLGWSAGVFIYANHLLDYEKEYYAT